MSTETVQRIRELLRRSLGAERVEILSEEETAVNEGAGLRQRLPSGRVVAAFFAGDPPADGAERLEVMVGSFEGLLEQAEVERRGGKQDRGEALVAELASLAGAAGASEALVIDAHSPVVWGSSHGVAAEEVLGPRLRLVTEEQGPPGPSPLSAEADEAIRWARALPETEALARGGHLRHAEASEGRGVLARSFAGIYVLLLVYPGLFDELGAERALHHALPAIERLVLGLPPPGQGGAMAARARPRR